ncbi:MAG: hypothetical protein ACREVQ_15060 [Burkholderiales bacterium]
MAELEHDTRVSAAYRELGADAPPAQLDAAVLAAARRRRPRWAVPVSVAAVVVLGLGVVLRVQREAPQPAEPVALEPRILQAPAAERKSAPASVSAAAAPVAKARDETFALRAPANVARGKISASAETPGQWLERIAKLRAEGKAEEADRSLAEFRRRYPEYRIPPAMRARIAPR